MKESELNRIKREIDECDSSMYNSSYVLGYVHALEVCGHQTDAKTIREYAKEKKISAVFS